MGFGGGMAAQRAVTEFSISMQLFKEKDPNSENLVLNATGYRSADTPCQGQAFEHGVEIIQYGLKILK
jgi:hypothetical protein